jgi:predicted amidohydrolase
MKVGFLQFCPVRNNVSENAQHVSRLLKSMDFDLMVLPELSNSGYLYDDRECLLKNSELIDGTGIFLSALWKICQEKRSCIITGISEQSNEHLFNSAVAISEDGIIARYRKTHLYNSEKELFTPGDTGFNVFEYRSVRIGMLICFDWIYPEASRKLAIDGAQIIAHPANLVTPYCQPAMITRSIENKVFTITSNRYGKETSQESSLVFTGKSQITSPGGKIIARSTQHGDKVVIIEIDPTLASDKKFSDNNDLFKDRRSQFY